MAYVYLLHFERPISPDHTARHYLGWTADLAARIQTHELGNGARLLQVASERDIDFQVVRVWLGDRQLERRLKNRKEAPRLCPICSAQPRPAAYADELNPTEIQELLIPF